MPFSDFQSAFDQMTDEFEYYNKIQELQSLRDPINQIINVKKCLTPEDKNIVKLENLLRILTNQDRVGVSVLNQAQIWVEHQIEVWRGDFSDEENLEMEEEKLEKEIVHVEDELTALIECPVCYEAYDDEDSMKKPIIFPCGHLCCINCKKQLVQKKCPKCAQRWIDSQIRFLQIPH